MKDLTLTYCDAATLRFYSEEAPIYTASGRDGASRHLERFLGLLEPRARILELGAAAVAIR